MKKKSSTPRQKKGAQWLVIDISNSTSKFALTTPQRILTTRRLATADLSLEALHAIIKGWSIEKLIVASVVPKTAKLVARFAKELRLPLLNIDANSDLGVTIRYPNPNSIGADRLVNVVAVKNRYATPCIVVNFGTAIVFDVIDKQGAYLGGVIAPGLFTAAKALHQQTALLPQTLPKPIRRALGKNTLAAIHSGLLLGARGLVREVVEQIAQENFSGKRPTLIATGTDATLVAGKTALFDHLDPHLTLDGIREVGLRIIGNKK